MNNYTTACRVRNVTAERLEADAYRQWRKSYQDRPSFASIVINTLFFFLLGAGLSCLFPQILISVAAFLFP